MESPERSQLEILAAPVRREFSIGPADSRESSPDKLRSLRRIHPAGSAVVLR
jgi:hypothetical protein